MKLIDRIKNNIEVRSKLKEQGKSNFFVSFGHAVDGISYVVSHERNFLIELVFAILVAIASFILKVSLIEWCLLVVVIGIVLALEMVNTAIERCVDLVTKDYRELARIAKDVSAGAVLVMSMFSVILGILIFLPKIIDLLKI